MLRRAAGKRERRAETDGARAPRGIAPRLAVLIVIALVGLVASAAGQTAGVRWFWSGALGPRTITIKARLTPGVPSASVSITAAGTTTVIRAPADQYAVVTFTTSDLVPGTRYTYRIEPSGGGNSSTGQFRTPLEERSDVTVAFASCARTGSNSRVFAAIARLEPDFFVHMGDFHYEDISRNDPERFRRAYDRVLTSGQSALFRAVPIVYTWDDHDFGSNNADRTSASRPAAQAVYRQMVPHHPLPSPEGLIYHAFNIGRVRLIVTDTRSGRSPDRERDDGSKTLLGAEQREWFTTELEKAAQTDDVVVWVNTVPWITRDERPTSNDGWQPYDRERQELANLIARLKLDRRIIMLSGDGHMVAIDDGTNSNYASTATPGQPAFAVMHAAPLDQTTNTEGGPYSHGVSRRNGQFGLLEIKDIDDGFEVSLTGRSIDGSVIRGMSLSMTCKAGRCTVVPRDDSR